MTIILLSANICQAERERIGFAVDQSVFDFGLDPGEEISFPFEVKSLEEGDQRMSVETKDFIIKAQNETLFLSESNPEYGARDWVTVNEEKWIFEGTGEKEIIFTIKIPEDATVGSHYTAVVLKALPAVDIENYQKPIVGGEIAIYVFVNVKGAIDGKGEISRFDAPQLVADQAKVEVDFKNLGNIHYIPHGEIEVKNLISGVAKKDRIESHFVFPGQSYSYSHHWQVPSVFGIYVAEAAFVDGNQSTLTARKIILGRFFFVIPLILIGAIMILAKWVIAGKEK